MPKILHLTDFHIAHPESAAGNECLRRGFFKEYIDRLFSELNSLPSDAGLFDLIAVTGDFVHQGRVDNFGHVSEIIDYLLSLSGSVDKKCVFCMGNHDLVRDMEKTGDHLGARRAFEDFRLNYSPTPVAELCGAKLFRFCNGVSCVSLDTTMGVAGEDLAGQIERDVIDTMVTDWFSDLLRDDIVLVMSHHPAAVLDICLDSSSEPDYFIRHFSHSAGQLLSRLEKLTRSQPIIWLSGDIHRTQSRRFGSVVCFATGRFGTAYDSSTPVPRQASLIEVDGHEVCQTLYNWIQSSHYDGDTGCWESSARKVCSERLGAAIELGSSAGDRAGTSAQVADECDVRGVSRVTVVDGEFEESILRSVKDHRLYRLGRYACGHEWVALSWISMNSLFHCLNFGMLSEVVNKLTCFLRSELVKCGVSKDELGSVLLVGIDGWGSAIASQIGYRSGIRCICAGFRGKGGHFTPEERLEYCLQDDSEHVRFVVLVMDVVRSGDTLCETTRITSRIWEEARRTGLRFGALGVLADSRQPSFRLPESIEFLGVCCDSIRMPLLRANDLPHEETLACDLDFRYNQSELGVGDDDR
jgi:hypothetical protein